MRDAYLTIDDSPTPHTDALIDALLARGVPAILFCRGDMIVENPDPVVRAIKNGFTVASHGYWHKRASQLGFDATCESIDRADALLDDCFKKAGVARRAKYYRFAYMDRGMGPWFVEPDSVLAADRPAVERLIREGLGNDPSVLSTPAQLEDKRRLQAHLRDRGYVPVPFRDIGHSFYAHSEMATAIDAMFTFSTSDWAVTARHRGKYGFGTVDDLCAAIDADPHLARDDTAHIVLAHDQSEIHDVTLALVDHMLAQGIQFRELET